MTQELELRPTRVPQPACVERLLRSSRGRIFLRLHHATLSFVDEISSPKAVAAITELTSLPLDRQRTEVTRARHRMQGQRKGGAS